VAVFSMTISLLGFSSDIALFAHPSVNKTQRACPTQGALAGLLDWSGMQFAIRVRTGFDKSSLRSWSEAENTIGSRKRVTKRNRRRGMTEQRTETHRLRLRALAHRLNGDMPGLRNAALRSSGGEASGGISNAPLHLADLATDSFEQEVALGLLQNQQQVLNAILVALDRLDAGTYGRCERCGQDIPEERLKVVTYATRCVSCEQLAELEGDISPGAGNE
jgi:DnaK suppressor protein